MRHEVNYFNMHIEYLWCAIQKLYGAPRSCNSPLAYRWHRWKSLCIFISYDWTGSNVMMTWWLKHSIQHVMFLKQMSCDLIYLIIIKYVDDSLTGNAFIEMEQPSFRPSTHDWCIFISFVWENYFRRRTVFAYAQPLFTSEMSIWNLQPPAYDEFHQNFIKNFINGLHPYLFRHLSILIN